MISVEIVYTDLPKEIKDLKGLCKKRTEDSYLVFINTCYNKRSQIKTLGHELAHIGLGHHEKAFSETVEQEADNMAKEYYDRYKSNSLGWAIIEHNRQFSAFYGNAWKKTMDQFCEV